MLIFLSSSVAALVIETRSAFLKPEEISSTKKLSFDEHRYNSFAQKTGKKKQKTKESGKTK